jgi:hypothetical protein
MYMVACKYIEVDADNRLQTLARPQVIMPEGQEAVVQVGGPGITFPDHLKERLANDIPLSTGPTAYTDDGKAKSPQKHAVKSATNWQIEVTPIKADTVLLDAKMNIANVDSVDEAGALISTQGLRVLRRVPLNKPISFDLPHGESKKRRIEFTVSEVKHSASR